VFATYRLRWQVELAFKTLKTVLKFDELPNACGYGPDLAVAKLICALLLQRLAERKSAIPPPESPRSPSRGEPRLSLPRGFVPSACPGRCPTRSLTLAARVAAIDRLPSCATAGARASSMLSSHDLSTALLSVFGLVVKSASARAEVVSTYEG